MCPPEEHKNHHSFLEKLRVGIRYAATELWEDLAGWFFVGVVVAGFITVLVPDELIGHYLGGGISAMLLMLVFGIPLYICATASTPIAAAFILKGVSPGAALVFLLVGPATNVTSLTVLVGLLGKRATAIYLSSIALVAVLCGLLVDLIYVSLGLSAAAIIGQAGEVIPHWLMLSATILLLALSVKPLLTIMKGWLNPEAGGCGCSSSATEVTAELHGHHHHESSTCGCESGCNSLHIAQGTGLEK
jgi:hypothetical protein